jgi:hypothetical protein
MNVWIAIQYLNEYLYLGDMNKELQNHFFIQIIYMGNCSHIEFVHGYHVYKKQTRRLMMHSKQI